MKFLISMHINPAVLDALTGEEKAATGEGHGRLIGALKGSGELITTQALAGPSQAAVARVRNGQPAVTDGPFPEAKEYVGGFYLLDCEDKQRAVELASHHRLLSVRAHLLEKAGDTAGAREHYRRAARATASIAEQRYLESRASRVRR